MTITLGENGSANQLRADLASTASAAPGDALIGVKSTLTDAVATTQHEVNSRVVSVKDFVGCDPSGATDSYAAFRAAHAALPATGGTIIVPDATGYKIDTMITCTKPILWKIGACTITGPASGYLFEIQANRSGIEGTAGTILKATQGCLGLIHNNQTLNCRYWNLDLNLNVCTGAVGLFYDGGWYISVKNIHVDFANEVSSSYTLKIWSTYTGIAGPTGSYGGAYVGTFDNLIGGKIIIGADLPQKATTMTFTGCSLKGITAGNSLSLTFLQPVVQGALTFFDLTNVAGLTCIGGDFEAGVTESSAIVYNLNGASNRDIISIGNQLSGFNPGAASYLIGTPSAGCVFNDKGLPGVAGDDSLIYGSLPGTSYRNSGYSVQSHTGLPYVGTALVHAQNIRLTSSTTGYPYDASTASTAIYMDTSARIKFFYANAATAWATSTLYSLGDVRRVGTQAYTCAVGHTSSVFATDLAAGKWTVGGNVSLFQIALFDSAGLTINGSLITTGALTASGASFNAANPVVSSIASALNNTAKFYLSDGTNTSQFVLSGGSSYFDVCGLLTLRNSAAGNATLLTINGTGCNFAGRVGFNGSANIAKPTITGSRVANPALASLLTALANYGLITDSTTI